MAISDTIQSMRTNIQNAYDKLAEKGATIPTNKNLLNLTTAIDSVPVGGSSGEYYVQVVDYDGTILKSANLDSGEIFTLPEQPTHSNLIFQEWSSPVTITNNTITVGDSDITIGAIYTTASGLSEFDITLNAVTGLNVSLYMDGTKDWGDGSSDTSTSHKYIDYGDYTITCNGTTLSTSVSTYPYFVNIRLANITSLNAYAIRGFYALRTITIPSGVTSIGNYAFSLDYCLININIPSGVTSIGESAFEGCYSLRSTAIPDSVTNIGCFKDCYCLRSVTIPEVTSLPAYAFGGCSSLRSVIIPDSVTSIGEDAISICSSLVRIKLSNNISSIPSYAIRGCKNLSAIMLPEGITTIGSNAFDSCSSLRTVIFPSSITSIGSAAFNACRSVILYDFSKVTEIPTLYNAQVFSGINAVCRIVVPASLLESWKTADKWSSYANYIYPAE